MSNIITRFPPSPTGYLHLGGARTALFNWLYARHTGGKFVLRIEDTDVERSTRQSADAIIESLNWMGIDWDEGPFYQSDRLDLYQEKVQILLNTGHAYYCTCSPDTLEAKRKAAMAAGKPVKYDGSCRDKNLSKSNDAVIRFRAPQTGSTVVNDRVKGNVAFQNHEMDDFIIQRQNGMPTYNFVVVVDDIDMQINTIIRGDDHLTNTPRQILLYQAFNQSLPEFAHVPMVLGSDKSRLSKRHGAMSVLEYRDKGYLPDAFINYLVRLGWSYGDQEFFSRNELIEKFSFENMGRSAGIFNPEKLLAINAEHMRCNSGALIYPHLKPFLQKYSDYPMMQPYVENVIETLKKRSKTLMEMADSAYFYFETKRIQYDEKPAKKFLTAQAVTPFKLLIEKLSRIDQIDESTFETMLKEISEQTGLKLGAIAQGIRISLTGKKVSPGLVEMVNVLGIKVVIERLNHAISWIDRPTK
ncbi:MAG: glutamyl-tRNA synthetase [Candidatus Magnetoglobus multicellularis str. Araruama]|uniref:Glutamate--tRNA ligase n=1 Tax=Candidatus Magnetoglobus multicellularis str. Araruama TaxID=890399 RepID=A0A1V1P9W3_9BACT|nr:MAG: glutamyl-tRNA synthetase [Candidatus Magnetoglobus multicellularis str. Araruama]